MAIEPIFDISHVDLSRAMYDREAIEAIMHADPYFGGAAADSILTGTSFDFSTEGERDMAAITLQYGFTYRTCAPAQPTTLDTLLIANVNYNLENTVHPDDEASDEIILDP